MIETPRKLPVFLHPGAEPTEPTDPPADPSEGGTRTVRVLATGRQRLVARLLDLVTIPLATLGPYVLLILVAMGPESVQPDDAVLVVMIVVAAIASLAVYVFMRMGRLVLWGCTVGHRIAGIRLVGLDGVSKPGWKQAFGRWMPVWGSSSTPGLWPWDDYLVYRQDTHSRQCHHDRKALTVVVLAENLPQDRKRRIVLAVVTAIAMLAVVAPVVRATVQSRNNAWDSPTRTVSFDVDDLYTTDERQDIRNNGRAATFDPVRGRTLDSREGCVAGAVDQRRRDLLSGLGCEGRVEMTYRTTGNVLVTGHVLRFPDTSTALGVLDKLAYDDLKFATDVSKAGAPKDGRVGSEGRYVVVTAGASPDAKLTEDAVALLHVSTLGVIIWS
ncbi:RDD family protein [Actinomadura sp. 9N407]|uniref:RDD family protein n=1 Tax=Actinomadura sp. 9N407 TaxID=3375154 RepID=UPI0037A22B67